MTSRLLTLFRSEEGASAAEFALVLPLLLILMFSVIDGGRLVYEINNAEKATQVGARMAIVTDVVSTGLRNEDYAGQTVGAQTIDPGGRIPAGALGTMVCTSTGCTCADTPPCPTDATVDSAAFTALLQRMQSIYPVIATENLQVSYSGSGFGFAGSASSGGGGGGGGGDGGGGGGAVEAMEISPLVTVQLVDLKFHPVTCLVFLCELDLPTFSTTLTAEDASGTFSN